MNNSTPKLFTIHSKPHQLKSIFEDLKELGYVLHPNLSLNGELNYQKICVDANHFYDGIKKIDFSRLYIGDQCTPKDNVIFQLPQDYSKALKFANEQLNHEYWILSEKITLTTQEMINMIHKYYEDRKTIGNEFDDTKWFNYNLK